MKTIVKDNNNTVDIRILPYGEKSLVHPEDVHYQLVKN